MFGSAIGWDINLFVNKYLNPLWERDSSWALGVDLWRDLINFMESF